MIWVGGERDRELGHEVRTSEYGERLGWVRYSGEWRHWRAFCDSARCGQVGDARTRPAAAALVRAHVSVEHR